MTGKRKNQHTFFRFFTFASWYLKRFERLYGSSPDFGVRHGMPSRFGQIEHLRAAFSAVQQFGTSGGYIIIFLTVNKQHGLPDSADNR